MADSRKKVKLKAQCTIIRSATDIIPISVEGAAYSQMRRIGGCKNFWIIYLFAKYLSSFAYNVYITVFKRLVKKIKVHKL